MADVSPVANGGMRHAGSGGSMTWSPPPTPGGRNRGEHGYEPCAERRGNGMEGCPWNERKPCDGNHGHLFGNTNTHVGCLHCLECCSGVLFDQTSDAANENAKLLHTCERTKWPGGYVSPVQYFAARRRQLQMLNRLPRQAMPELEKLWAKPERPVDTVCPLRHRRRRSPIFILVPRSRTNIKEEDCAVFVVHKDSEQVILQDGTVQLSFDRGFAGQCLKDEEAAPAASPPSPFPFASMLRSFFHSDLVDRWFRKGYNGKKRRTEVDLSDVSYGGNSNLNACDVEPAALRDMDKQHLVLSHEQVSEPAKTCTCDACTETEHVVAIPEEEPEKTRTWVVSAATSMLAAAFLGFTMIAKS